MIQDLSDQNIHDIVCVYSPNLAGYYNIPSDKIDMFTVIIE